MFYYLLKLYGRFAIKIFCRKIIINKPDFLSLKGPLLLAANHPNSFLDGIIITILFDCPIYALARGDAFKKERISKILRWLKQLPVYRTSEGVDNLKSNYTTFSSCHQKFKEGKIVIIFSEALCVNEWHLRPLRKGTARLAISSWQQNIPLQVLPVGINYDSFKTFGKEVHINFGSSINQSIVQAQTDGMQLNQFNVELYNQLRSLVYEIEEPSRLKEFFPDEKMTMRSWLLFIPALVGLITHAPLFFMCLAITKLKFRNSDHFDSVLVALLFLAYPVYLLLLVYLFYTVFGPFILILLMILPFTAWACVQMKHFFVNKNPGPMARD